MSQAKPSRRPHLRLVSVEGKPTAEERTALEHAVAAIVESQRQARTPSVWLRAGRAHGRRLGMYDYRDRFEAVDAWRLSLRFPAAAREHDGRAGRGDSR
jgi:hypothetical protein